MANFALESLKPHMKQQSVEYERNKFEELLKTQQGINMASSSMITLINKKKCVIKIFLEEITDNPLCF